MKICFAASSGGHLEEISRLREIEETHESILVTENTNFQELHFCPKVYYVPQINRKEPLFLFKLIKIFIQSAMILKKERPDCIISTGALAATPICMLGKWSKRKVIYIESFARVDSPSLTGTIVYKLKLADLFLVQWKEMLEFYPDAVYCGGIF